MKSTPCREQPDVLASFRKGFPSEEDREHLAGCQDCAEALAIAESLRALDTQESAPHLPHPDFIWRKAQVVAGIRTERRRQRFLFAIQFAGICLGLVLTWILAESVFPGITLAIPDLLAIPAAALGRVHPLILWTCGLGAATVAVTQLLVSRWDAGGRTPSGRPS